jgi:hypothetical protein
MNISFSDFWGGFDYKNNFFIHYIKQLFPDRSIYVTSIEEADFLIYCNFGTNHLSANRNKVKKIFYTGENIRPNFNDCDYSFTFDFDDYGDRNIRIPLWYLYIDWFDVKSYGNPQYLVSPKTFKQKWFNVPKIKNCCTVFSNPKPERFAMVNAMSRYMSVDGYGIPFNSHTIGEEDKYQKISEYRCSICFENSSYSGYVTEKLLHARTAGNLSVYWGHRDVEKDFNPNGFISANNFNSFEDCAAYVNEVMNDHHKYDSIVNAPVFSSPLFSFNEKVIKILS